MMSETLALNESLPMSAVRLRLMQRARPSRLHVMRKVWSGETARQQMSREASKGSVRVLFSTRLKMETLQGGGETIVRAGEGKWLGVCAPVAHGADERVACKDNRARALVAHARELCKLEPERAHAVCACV